VVGKRVPMPGRPICGVRHARPTGPMIFPWHRESASISIEGKIAILGQAFRQGTGLTGVSSLN